MKYVLVHGDGLADWPRQDLGGRTPLQAAATPNLDALAQNGELGLVTVQADGLIPNSDITELSLLGYDPQKSYAGPAPFEAAGLGIIMGQHDVVYRCNMVTLRGADPKGKGSPTEVKKLGPSVIMDDDTAGGLDSEEARELIDAVNEQLGSETIQFYPGSGHRHLMVWVGGKVRITCVNPHDVVGRSIGENLPTGDGSEILRKLMDASLIILRDHPINDQRREAGLKPAHCLWLWGQGRAPHLPSLTERRQMTGTVLSRSDIHRGIAVSAGLEAGLLADSDGTDFLRLGEAALHELEKKDFAYVHAYAPLDVALDTDPKTKMTMVEEFDQKVVGTIMKGLPKQGPHRILLVCDRPMATGTTPGSVSSVPYVLYEGPGHGEKAFSRGFSEAGAESATSARRDATKLLNLMLAGG